MADTAYGSETPEPSRHLDTRVAVLEEIARGTREVLGEIKAEMRALRSEMGDLRKDAKADFRWLLSLIIAGNGALLGVMAHGFHWF